MLYHATTSEYNCQAWAGSLCSRRAGGPGRQECDRCSGNEVGATGHGETSHGDIGRPRVCAAWQPGHWLTYLQFKKPYGVFGGTKD
eukprot:11211561-Lingulodinium_polyedra.AAC.1